MKKSKGQKMSEDKNVEEICTAEISQFLPDAIPEECKRRIARYYIPMAKSVYDDPAEDCLYTIDMLVAQKLLLMKTKSTILSQKGGSEALESVDRLIDSALTKARNEYLSQTKH